MRANRRNYVVLLVVGAVLVVAPADPQKSNAQSTKKVVAIQRAPAPQHERVRQNRVLDEKVNLNTASAEQLDRLPGVGTALAERILEYRSKVGKFSEVEELLKVKGMNDKKLLKLRNRLVL